jgi:glycerophosphoryl diester phosphodiesterase
MLFCLMSVIAAGAPSDSVPLLVAHRGESADAPENTLAAFRLAWEREVAVIELDVHLAKDQSLVVCHDADTKRTTGTELAIRRSTLDELQPLDAGRWKGERWAGEKLPTLDQALATIPPSGGCFIEVKVGPEAIPALKESIRRSGKKPTQLTVISFHDATIAESKRVLPEIRAYLLSGFKQDKTTGDWSPTVDDLIRRAKSIHADGLDLGYKGPIDQAFVQRVQAADLELHIYTVDDEAVARKFAAWGVDGITTNRAAWLRERLRAGGSRN